MKWDNCRVGIEDEDRREDGWKPDHSRAPRWWVRSFSSWLFESFPLLLLKTSKNNFQTVLNERWRRNESPIISETNRSPSHSTIPSIRRIKMEANLQVSLFKFFFMNYDLIFEMMPFLNIALCIFCKFVGIHYIQSFEHLPFLKLGS